MGEAKEVEEKGERKRSGEEKGGPPEEAFTAGIPRIGGSEVYTESDRR